MKKYSVWLFLFTFLLVFLPVANEASAEPLNEARHLLRDYYVDEIPETVLSKGTIRKITDALDPHTVYMNAAEYKAFINGIESRIVGIGVMLEEHQKGIKITSVIPKGPADRAEITAGDIITHVDGRSMSGKSVLTAISWIGGDENTTVTLKLLREGTTTTKKLQREAITLANVESTLLGGNVGYIRLDSFATESASEMNKAIRSLPRAESWIIDVRNNGGGYITSAQEIIGFFPSVTQAFQLRDRVNGAVTYPAIKQPNQLTKPVALLINAHSASASEMVAGTVKERKAATLYGQTSYGKGSMQSMFDFKDGSVLKMTTARFYSPGGQPVDKIGVTPNVITKAGRELEHAHRAQLISNMKTYKRLPSLTKVPVTKEFTIEMNTTMDWSKIDQSAIQLIQLGGTDIDSTITVKNSKTLTVKPKKPLISGAEYLLVVHPKWKSTQAKPLQQGIYLDITVK